MSFSARFRGACRVDANLWLPGVLAKDTWLDSNHVESALKDRFPETSAFEDVPWLTLRSMASGMLRRNVTQARRGKL